MRDSGIKWIGKIPDSWKVERLQWHLDEVKESNDPIKTTQILSLTNKLGVIPYEEKGEQGNKAKEKLDDYKLAYPNTIVANSMNILIGSVGKCDYFGCVSPVYYVFKPRPGENIEFYNYIFQTSQFQKELRKYANGILEIRLRVSANNILKREVAVPSLVVQNKIVSFLNNKCSEIDELISIESLQIKKLQEYKQAIISETVTKGLNDNVSYVDSGNIFLGNVPQHWKLNKVKFIASRLGKGNGITKEDIFVDGDTPCVRYGEIYTKYNISFKECMTRTNKSVVSKEEYFEHGDILFSGTGELVEEIGKNIVYLGNEKCLAGGDIIILSHNQNPLFMSYLLNSSVCQMQKSYGKAKLKVVHISATEIGNINIVLPPIDEQNEIALFLENKCNEIDILINLKQKKIEELYDYKKSTIYEYITGKRVL